MKTIPFLKYIVPLIFILTLAATLAGLWPGEGTPYPLTNFRGEQVTINARGLYYWDTLSSASQMQANDLVMLVIGLPLMAVSFWLTMRGSLRGRLLLTGTLGFILYTYITMCFGAAYNKLFLVYVALFSLSLFTFILSMMSFDLKTLPCALFRAFTTQLDRRAVVFCGNLPGIGLVRTNFCDLCFQKLFLYWKMLPVCLSRPWIWASSFRCVCWPVCCFCAGMPGVTC